jgi:putative two-component system response regulator
MENSAEQQKEKLVILIVDDNPVNLRTMKVLLGTKFEVITVKTGMEGMNVLKLRKIDLILLDIEMPVMSGFDFMNQLKEMPDQCDIPVIIVTGNDATPELINSIIQAGAKDLIVKPFEPDTITIKVHKVLRLNEFIL